ncbi:MAG: PQQ-dependent sugar dehydrogenase [Burkholderiales bacterium]|nr:PQQ-dependent sugar dehydrogenase [Burkholderiales bacterium]
MIPNDNPFVGSDTVLNEIYAFGFRNPFRFSFDQVTGALVLADVGQNDIEEVNIVQAGGNYGWPLGRPFPF